MRNFSPTPALGGTTLPFETPHQICRILLHKLAVRHGHRLWWQAQLFVQNVAFIGSHVYEVIQQCPVPLVGSLVHGVTLEWSSTLTLILCQFILWITVLDFFIHWIEPLGLCSDHILCSPVLYRFSTRAGTEVIAHLETGMCFSTQKKKSHGPVPRSWFRTSPKTLLVSNKVTYYVSRRSFHYRPQFLNEAQFLVH